MQSEAINKADLIAIRAGVLEDRNFIFASWLRGLYYGDSWFSEIPKNIFMEHYHKAVEFILNNPNTIVQIACLKEDPSIILGYAVSSNSGALHWCFVKKNWRNIGIAKDLVRSPEYVTHLTKVGLSISKRKGLIFNPFKV